MPNVKRVAIVKNANEWADTKTAPLLAALKGKVDVVDTEQINNSASDATAQVLRVKEHHPDATVVIAYPAETAVFLRDAHKYGRSEEHTSELQSLMRISYAVFCLKKK